MNRKPKVKQYKATKVIPATVIRVTGGQTMMITTIIMMTGMTMICRRKKVTGSVEPGGRFYKKINGNIGEKFNLNVKKPIKSSADF